MASNSTHPFTMRPNARPFIPKSLRPPRPCRDYPFGTCKYGPDCRFLHDPAQVKVRTDGNGITAAEEEELAAEVTKLELAKDEVAFSTFNENACSRELGGAVVTFGSGAQVMAIKLTSDVSTAQIVGLPTEAKEKSVVELLKDLGFKISESSIKINKPAATNPGPSSGCIATVTFDDPETAKSVVATFEREVGVAQKGLLSIKEIFSGSRFGNWVQTSSVTCSWFKPSRMARLIYNDPTALYRAADFLLTQRSPSGRTLACLFRQPGPKNRANRFTLEVRNLDVDCTVGWFERVLSPPDAPLKIKMKEPTHDLSDTESREIVESMLTSIGGFGSLEMFNFWNDPRSIKFNVTATFFDPANVTKAVETLTKSHDEIGELSVKPLVSVKFNVPAKIVEAIRPDLEKLKTQSRQEYRVQLKLPSSNARRSFLSLRISTDGTAALKLPCFSRNTILF